MWYGSDLVQHTLTFSAISNVYFVFAGSYKDQAVIDRPNIKGILVNEIVLVLTS